jgi:hypothetical protein
MQCTWLYVPYLTMVLLILDLIILMIQDFPHFSCFCASRYFSFVVRNLCILLTVVDEKNVMIHHQSFIFAVVLYLNSQKNLPLCFSLLVSFFRFSWCLYTIVMTCFYVVYHCIAWLCIAWIAMITFYSTIYVRIVHISHSGHAYIDDQPTADDGDDVKFNAEHLRNVDLNWLILACEYLLHVIMRKFTIPQWHIG